MPRFDVSRLLQRQVSGRVQFTNGVRLLFPNRIGVGRLDSLREFCINLARQLAVSDVKPHRLIRGAIVFGNQDAIAQRS